MPDYYLFDDGASYGVMTKSQWARWFREVAPEWDTTIDVLLGELVPLKTAVRNIGLDAILRIERISRGAQRAARKSIAK